MDLASQLKASLQTVADKAGRAETQMEFQDELLALTLELQSALQVVRQLCFMQAGWLQEQAGKQARDN